jgi:hypothetical protein
MIGACGRLSRLNANGPPSAEESNGSTAIVTAMALINNDQEFRKYPAFLVVSPALHRDLLNAFCCKRPSPRDKSDLTTIALSLMERATAASSDIRVAWQSRVILALCISNH